MEGPPSTSGNGRSSASALSSLSFFFICNWMFSYFYQKMKYKSICMCLYICPFVYLFVLFLYICLFCVCIFAYFRFVYLFILYLYFCLIVLVYLPILYLYFCCCSFVFLLSVLVSWQQYQRWKHFRAEHYLPSMPATAILPIQLPGHHVTVFCILYLPSMPETAIILIHLPGHHVAVFSTVFVFISMYFFSYSTQATMLLYFHRICAHFSVIFFFLKVFGTMFDMVYGSFLAICANASSGAKFWSGKLATLCHNSVWEIWHK